MNLTFWETDPVHIIKDIFVWLYVIYYIIYILKVYLFIIWRGTRGRGTQRKRASQADSLHSTEPNMSLSL